MATAKAGVEVGRTVASVLSAPVRQWPNARDALMELSVVLDHWCSAAFQSSSCVQEAIEFRENRPGEPVPLPTPVDVRFSNAWIPVVIGPGYVERITRELTEVLDPQVPRRVRLLNRPRSRLFRRRTLKNLIAIYYPELLQSCESATGARGAWVRANRDGFLERLRDLDVPIGELRRQLEESESTRAALVAVRDRLRELIRTQFPLDTGG
ncbi:hypothetical protein ACFRAI_22335 [Streptomyces sp. NPDC056637]|uniref:hypothetical protein n=1 Tax=unclassified Streptomyces TaxID=2593676 RepID=UPI0036C8F9F8